MATATSDVDEIRRQMAQIRHDLHQDVQGVVAGAEAVTDWQRYLRSYPWVALGAAAAVGYLLVPRRHHTTVIQAAPVAAQPLAQSEEAPKKEKASKGMFSMAMGVLTPVLVRAAQGYAVNYLENWIVQQQQGAMMPTGGPASKSSSSHPANPGHSTGV